MKWYKRNKLIEKCNWYKWFAWYPVNVEVTSDGDKKYIWWEWVWARKVFYGYSFEGHELLENQYKEMKN